MHTSEWICAYIHIHTHTYRSVVLKAHFQTLIVTLVEMRKAVAPLSRRHCHSAQHFERRDLIVLILVFCIHMNRVIYKFTDNILQVNPCMLWTALSLEFPIFFRRGLKKGINFSSACSF